MTAELVSTLMGLTVVNVLKVINWTEVAKNASMTMNVSACLTFAETELVPIWMEVLSVIVRKDMLQVR